MADLSEQEYDETGLEVTMSSAASGGDEFTNYGKQKVLIHNSSGSDRTITAVAQDNEFDDNQYGISKKEDQVKTISAGGIGFMGPFSRKAFNDSNGKVQLTYDDNTSLEVAVLKEKK